MSAPEALAYTGLALLFSAFVVGAVGGVGADRFRARRRFATAGWALFSLGIACFIGAAWWGVVA